MKTNFKSYPHPVLGNEDDIRGQFKPSFTYTLDPQTVLLEYDLELKNGTIEKLIKNNSAVFWIQTECPSTFFRRSFETNKSAGRIELNPNELREKVTVSFFIVAKKNISDYKPDGCHPDYGGTKFNIEKGDVLADGGSGSFLAEKSFDPLKAPVSSFLKIREGYEKSGAMQIDYGEDKIIISLSKDDWSKYLIIRNYQVNNLHASIVLPALADAITTMRDKKAVFESNDWFMRLEAICRERKIDPEEPLEATQKILSMPISRNFNEAVRLIKSDEEFGNG